MIPSNEDFNINHNKKDLKVGNFDTNISSFLDDSFVDPLCESQEWDLFWEELDLILPNLLFDTVRKWEWHNFWEDMDLILQNNFLLFDTTVIGGAEWEQSEKEKTKEKPFTDLSNIQREEAKKSGKEEIKKKALTEWSNIQTEEAESKQPGKQEIKNKTLTDLSNIQTEEARSEQSVTGETKDKPFTDLLNIQNNQESLSEERNMFLSSYVRKPRTKIVRAERRFSTSWSESEIGFQNLKLYESDVKKGKKICSHCKAEKTPQWRAGPLGPNTLCNACGVRYKSGRLLPEYRPAASPTFDVSKHSNVHRKILQMRACSFR